MDDGAYLDNSATTRPSEGVIAAMSECMREGFYNPSAMYEPALRSEKRMADTRARVAEALHVSPAWVYFTSGGTEANNLGILGAAAAMRGARHFVVSSVEHPSVLACFEALREMGHRVTVLPVDAFGQPDWEAFERALDDPPSLVSCMQVNNETGAMPDLSRLVAMTRCKAPECLIHVDGVQGFLRVPFDAREVDLYTFSGHKIHGPKGVGGLCVRPGVKLKPRQIGGGQEKTVRSGTENTPGIAGLGEAVSEMLGMGDLDARLRPLKRKMAALFFEAAPGARVNGPSPEDGAPHILNVSFPDVRGEVLLHALEAEKVYCSTGSACSSKKRKLSPVLLSMGVSPETAEGALRFSLSPHTREGEIDYAADTIHKLYASLRRYQRR